MIKCRVCGVPRVFSYTTHWTDEGVILSMPRGLIRLLFMEREHMVAVFQAIEEKLGLPIDHIITEAKRKDAWTYVQDVLSPVVHETVRKPLLRRLAYLAMIKQAATIGLGKAKLLEYREGKLLVGKISPVYYHALFAGDALGPSRPLRAGGPNSPTTPFSPRRCSCASRLPKTLTLASGSNLRRRPS